VFLLRPFGLPDCPGDRRRNDAPRIRSRYLKVDFGSWSLTQQTESAFRDECERLFRRELDAFCKSLEEQALTRGMERTREMRAPVHFQWLARRIVKGERIADIHRSLANSVSITQRAIGKAINEFAHALDLELPARSSDSDIRLYRLCGD
jgi:hypothetical protein